MPYPYGIDVISGSIACVSLRPRGPRTGLRRGATGTVSRPVHHRWRIADASHSRRPVPLTRGLRSGGASEADQATRAEYPSRGPEFATGNNQPAPPRTYLPSPDSRGTRLVRACPGRRRPPPSDASSASPTHPVLSRLASRSVRYPSPTPCETSPCAHRQLHMIERGAAAGFCGLRPVRRRVCRRASRLVAERL